MRSRLVKAPHLERPTKERMTTMNETSKLPEDANCTTDGSHHRLSRRMFISASAATVGGFAIWSLRPTNIASAAPGTADALPPTVTIVEFGTNGKVTGKLVVPTVAKTDAGWKRQLSSISYDVTRRAGTERPYTGDSWDLHDHGLFRCICCDTALFSSDTKFDSGTGWPSFWQPLAKENVVERIDSTLGMDRAAISCRRCDAHLGHVFDDGPPPTGLRYCMNSAAMRFVELT